MKLLMMTHSKESSNHLKNSLATLCAFCVCAFAPLYARSVSAESIMELKQEILAMDSRNMAVDFSISRSNLELSFCVHGISEETSSVDVFRVLLHTAVAFSDQLFDRINLCFRGENRYALKGSEFRKLGTDYGIQNPIYTMRTFAQLLELPTGERAFKIRSGGVLYLLRVQMEDFQAANNHWFLSEILDERIKEIEAIRPTVFADDHDVF